MAGESRLTAHIFDDPYYVGIADSLQGKWYFLEFYKTFCRNYPGAEHNGEVFVKSGRDGNPETALWRKVTGFVHDAPLKGMIDAVVEVDDIGICAIRSFSDIRFIKKGEDLNKVLPDYDPDKRTMHDDVRDGNASYDNPYS